MPSPKGGNGDGKVKQEGGLEKKALIQCLPMPALTYITTPSPKGYIRLMNKASFTSNAIDNEHL